MIREFVQHLSAKYLPFNMSLFFNVTFTLDNHLAERMIERKFKKEAFERLVTGLVKNHLCEVIYLSILEPSVRINILDKSGLLLGVTGKHYEDGNFNIKLHTCFIPNNQEAIKLIKTKVIKLKNKEESKDDTTNN